MGAGGRCYPAACSNVEIAQRRAAADSLSFSCSARFKDPYNFSSLFSNVSFHLLPALPGRDGIFFAYLTIPYFSFMYPSISFFAWKIAPKIPFPTTVKKSQSLKIIFITVDFNILKIHSSPFFDIVYYFFSIVHIIV